MELQKTPITYQQASEVLGVSLETIKKAVLRGVLTRLPREGLYQHLMAGQVELFKGKTLSLSVLSENGRKLWQAYADSMKVPLQAHFHGTGSLAVQDIAVIPEGSPEHRSDGSYSEAELANAIAERIAVLAVSDNSPKTSEELTVFVLALLVAGGLLWILDEQDKQKRAQAIDQAVKSIANPGDRFTVKTLLEDDTVMKRLRIIHATAALS